MKLNSLGQRFGRLLVITDAPSRKGQCFWRCLCDCGNEKVVNAFSLRSGVTKSCGCLHKEIVSRIKTTHGQAGKTGFHTKEYTAWVAMKGRCNNPKNSEHANYGERGIKVCDRWLESFENFYADMGKAPDLNYSIDRKNNDGDYRPDNCYWATPLEQGNNRRPCIKVVYEGVMYPSLTSAARALNVNYKSLYAAHVTRNVPIEQAVTRAIELRDRRTRAL